MKLINNLRKAYSLVIVRNLWNKWFNPLYTIYFNLIFFPFRQAIKLPVFIYGWPKLYSQYGSMVCIGKCYTGMVKINISYTGGPQAATSNTELNIWGKIIFRGKCEIGSGNKINVGINGLFDLGNNIKIANLCNVTVYNNINIGNFTRIAHRCQLLDSNFHYIADFGKKIIKQRTHPISIGNYCWICNSTTITGGTAIPNKIIVASNSLVGKNYMTIPEESIIGGIPAKLISTGFRRVENMNLEKIIHKYFLDNPEAKFYELDDNISHNICDFEE